MIRSRRISGCGRKLAYAMEDAHLAARNRHHHALADQPPRHRVAVRLDGAIVADHAGQFSQRSERRRRAERLEPVCLFTRKSE
ncbi:hypothetical protein J6524_09735 [Bradyrhizobium sp. WSM 1738]|nr:hypothetical protein [Bradyrhizobium hereditatis]MCA6115180.1 hypothetical protein [Bradyrhizobium hereditatis]